MENNTLNIDKTENQNKSPWNYAFKWALIGFLIYVIQMMVNMYMNDGDYNPRAAGWLQMLIGVVVLFFPMTMLIKEYRDQANDGFISFGGAFKIGFFYTLISAVLSLAFMAIFFNFIIDFDTYIANQIDISVKLLKDRGMSDAEISKNLAQAPAWSSTQWFTLSMIFIGSLFMNVIADLIVSAILKRNNPNA